MRGKEERMGKSEENEKRKGRKRKREEEKGENETETVKRRCEGFVSVEAFEIFSERERLLESCGDLSWCETPWRSTRTCLIMSLDSCAHLRVVPEVTDVLVSLSSVVTEFCEVSACCSDWEDVVPQSFSFCKMRAFCCASAQEEMRYEGSQGKAPPMARRRMTPSTPLQNSYAFFEGA